MIKVTIEQTRKEVIGQTEFDTTIAFEGGRFTSMEDVGVLANLILGHFDNTVIKVEKEDK